MSDGLGEKYFAALVISKKPINLISVDRDDVQHLINEKFEIEVDEDKAGWVITRKADEHFRYKGVGVIKGEGRSVSAVIMAWLSCLILSIPYKPFREKKKG